MLRSGEGLSSESKLAFLVRTTTTFASQIRVGSTVRLGMNEKRHVYEWDDHQVGVRMEWEDRERSACEDL